MSSSSLQQPPAFQESSRCDVCHCSFNTFRRRHHCRCCGRTLCAEHSSNQMPLPQFGIHSAVRVCSNCFNDSSRPGKAHGTDSGDLVADSFSKLDINSVSGSETKHSDDVAISECKCGMPLCICEAPSSDAAEALQPKASPPITVLSCSKTKKVDTASKSRGSASNIKHGPALNGQVSNTNVEKSVANYEVNGEGLREAIKNGDTSAARKLLSEGVDPNYCDKQGLSLLHLAAVFNRTEIVFNLMEYGAKTDCKNSQGETPLDCAPVTLQFKMKKKMEESLH